MLHSDNYVLYLESIVLSLMAERGDRSVIQIRDNKAPLPLKGMTCDPLLVEQQIEEQRNSRNQSELKISINIDQAKLPLPFKITGKNKAAGIENIISFLRDYLVNEPIEKKLDNLVRVSENEAMQIATTKAIDADVELGKLILNNVKFNIRNEYPNE